MNEHYIHPDAIQTSKFNLKPVLPGKIITAELEARKLTVKDLAEALGWPESLIEKYIKGLAKIDYELSAMLGKAFGVSQNYFLQLQVDYDNNVKMQNLKNVLIKVRELPGGRKL